MELLESNRQPYGNVISTALARQVHMHLGRKALEGIGMVVVLPSHLSVLQL
jgi:hypothetical protein